MLRVAKDLENKRKNTSEFSASKKNYIVSSKGNVYNGSRLKKIQMPVYFVYSIMKRKIIVGFTCVSNRKVVRLESKTMR